jgi:molecular chaperone GrpE
MTSARNEPQPQDLPAQGSASEERPTTEGGGDESAEEQAVTEDLDRLLDDVRRERDSYLELAQRAKADFENYRKRAARETSEAERRAKASLARDLVPAIDNLERALRAAGADPAAAGAAESGDDSGDQRSALLRGVALVLADLQASLERAGVEAYDPVGERFDPSWHEALQTRSVDGTEAGVVVETLERGYRLDGQVLRAARVVVSE